MTKHKIKPIDNQIDFVAQEKALLEKWYAPKGIHQQYLEKNKGSKTRFSFFDGPITANNPMAVHHGWGRTYKDVWQRYHTMKGDALRYQNGFDCQGLWVEVEVEKELGFKSKQDIETYGIAKFVEKCKDRVKRYSAIQTQQSQRLGYFMDWEHSYFTMSDENNYMIWHFLKVCHEKGWLYKGKESVPWCPRCQTAISQHEILTADYTEATHDSIYLQLPITGRTNEYLLVWTTTPWTIPANIAVAVDPKLKYSLVKGTTGDTFWVAAALVAAVFGKKAEVLKTVLGKELVGLKYSAPFDHLPAVAAVAKANPDTFHTVVPSDPLILPILTTEGTGLVHTAVSAGTEDFKLGKKLGLPMVPVIADDASYLEGLDFLTGKNAKDHPEIILDYLKAEDAKGHDCVFKIEGYTHRYPACWRCQTELVWKVADEWYIAMDKPDPADKKGRTLREKMVAVAKKITWLPKFGLQRELDWLKNMHDWLISKKNRYWGLSLPIWVCDQCQEFTVIGNKDELQQKATAGWNEFAGHTPHRPYIDAVKLKCSCGGTMSRILDVGNPWLDAGIIPFSTLIDPKTGKLSYTTDKEYWRQWFPAAFITESFPGQFKNWFYSLITMSAVLEDTNSFDTVLGYASVLAEDGREMHKSWGNAIEFNEAADKIGVDVMRWVYTRQNPSRNLLFGYNLADETRRRFHMILWNSYRFFANYAALDNWAPQNDLQLTPSLLDSWIINRLAQTVNRVTKSLDKYDAFTATGALEVLVQDLSTWYIRRSRDRVGPNVPDSIDKQTCYHTLYTVLETLSRLLMPFTPFLADQIYTNLTGEASVNLASWPESGKTKDLNLTLINQMTQVRQIVELGHSQRKQQNLPVRQPLASLTVTGTDSLPDSLVKLIADELNVQTITFKTGPELSVKLDTKLTPDLIAQGEARKLIRDIQESRKAAGCKLDEHVTVVLPNWPKDYEQLIKDKTLADTIKQGDTLTITRKK